MGTNLKNLMKNKKLKKDDESIDEPVSNTLIESDNTEKNSPTNESDNTPSDSLENTNTEKPKTVKKKKSRGRPKSVNENETYHMLRVKNKTHARLAMAKTIDQIKTIDEIVNHVLDTYTPKNVDKKTFDLLMSNWSVMNNNNE